MPVRKIFNSIRVFVFLGGLVAGTLVIRQQISLNSHASGTPASLVYDFGATSSAKNSWQFLSQGGEERNPHSLSPVVSQVQSIHPQYIRIDHIYDFFSIVSKNTQGALAYNWSDFDTYIQDILKTGAKPFLSLSYAPTALADHDVDMPNLPLWTQIVKATIEHISGKNNLGVSDVYYEVWNEPDLFGQFKVYPPKDYGDLYKASSVGAQSAQNVLAFKLGGPATTGLYKNWFDALANLSKTQKTRFDFFSWHVYGQDTTTLSQNISDVLAWKKEANLPNLELYVTENGIDAANNTAYDGSLGAFHTFSAVATSADKLDGLFSFEIKDGAGPNQYWGRWGLFTHEKFGTPVPKPRYRALEFLNNMNKGSQLPVTGNGSYVSSFARVDGTTTRIFVVNYDPDGKHVEAVPMHFSGITAKRFLFTRRDYQGKSTPLLVIPTNGVWDTVQYFPVNSAAIFEITPQS